MDLTQAAAYAAIRSTIEARTPLSADTEALGNRETAWTRVHRTFRLDPGEWEDLGWYRGADRLRIQEQIVVHLSHKVAKNQRDSLDVARNDAQRFPRDVCRAVSLVTAGLVVELAGPITMKQTGDRIETDVPLACQYDMALVST